MSASKQSKAAAEGMDEDEKKMRLTKMAVRDGFSVLAECMEERAGELDNPDNVMFKRLGNQADIFQQNVMEPMEGLQDAIVYSGLGRSALRMAANVSRDLTSEPKAVVERLSREWSQNGRLDFRKMGAAVSGLYPRIPHHLFIAGPLERTPRTPVVRTQQKRSAPAAEVNLKQAVSDPSKESSVDHTTKMTNRLRKRAKKGILLCQSLVDRNSFTNTVENLFFLTHTIAENRRNPEMPPLVLHPSNHDVLMKIAEEPNPNEEPFQYVLKFDFETYQRLLDTEQEED